MEAGPAVPTEAEETIQDAVAATNGGSPPEADAAERTEAERRSHRDLFKYSRYVHVGPGAEECDEGTNGSCTNAMHFHAWCRLPNQFQHSSIREKALAAKARRLRLLNEEDSDARVILDESVNELVRADDRAGMIEELAQKDWTSDYMKAVQEVNEEEEYKHIEDDRERWRALRAKSEEERPQEEYAELEKHLDAYAERVQAAFQELQQPLREALDQKSTDELGGLLREQRMEGDAQRAFNDTYGQFEQYIGTLKPKSPEKPGMPSERVFPDINVMLAAAPEVIEALQQTFEEMEAESSRALKNS